MRLYGRIWDDIRLYGIIWDDIGLYGMIWDYMELNAINQGFSMMGYSDSSSAGLP